MTESIKECHCVRCKETALDDGLCQTHISIYGTTQNYDKIIKEDREKAKARKELTQYEESLNTEQLLIFLGYFTEETQPSKFDVFKNQEMMEWSMKTMVD